MKKFVGQIVGIVVLSAIAWAAPQDKQVETAVEKALLNQKIAGQTLQKVQTTLDLRIGKLTSDISGLLLDKIGTRLDGLVLTELDAKLATLGDEQDWGHEQDDRAREQAERAREQADRTREQAERAREQAERIREQSDSLYEQAYRSLDDGRWERAAALFERVANAKAARADGALYWKAYAQNKQGLRDAALASLASLKSTYASSRWINDANALEAEIKQGAGQPVSPEGQSDDDLKLMALNSLMRSNPETALPVLEKFLKGSQPPRLKEKALFVLAQNPSPKSRELLAQFARGQVNPDLQLKAVEYLGVYGGKENGQLLGDIYSNSQDQEVKKRILRSFMMTGDRERLYNAAKGEQNPDLRREAIRQLGIMGRGRRGVGYGVGRGVGGGIGGGVRGGPGSEPLPGESDELWKLYQGESSPEVKKEILNALFIQGNSDKVTEVARSEKDSSLRRDAIHRLGMMKSSDALVALYPAEKEYDVKREIINGMFIAGNCKGMVDVARKESDPNLKKELVSRLGMMRSCKEASDYMMEILSK